MRPSSSFRPAAPVILIIIVASIIVITPPAARAQDASPSPGSATQSPPSVPPQDTKPIRIRVGGNVTAAKIIKQVQPLYPPIAKTAGICGTVVLHTIIAKDGTVDELEYVSGPVLLMKAAMDAVKQWQYAPTLLAGEPVMVDTTISVVFALSGCKAANNAPPSGAPATDASTSTEPSITVAGSADGSSSKVTFANPPHIKPANVSAATLLKQVAPKYPQSAKDAGICGTVVLHAIIRKDGSVGTITYVSGPQQLLKSATDAVHKWKYKPMELNGEPMEVDTRVSVVFQLDGCTPEEPPTS